MKKYIVKTNSGYYVTTIYRTSLSTGSDIGDALEVDTLEEAKIVKSIMCKRTSTDLVIMCIETTVSAIDESEGC